MKLAQYKGNKLGKTEVTPTTDEELQAELKNMVEHAKTTVEKEGKSEKGDTVTIDFEGFVDGVAFEGGKAEAYDLELGSGSFIPGFEDQLIGYEKDADVDVNVTFPENYQAENLKGKKALFKCKIHAVKKPVTPELNDEFAKMYGYEKLEELQADLLAQMDSKKHEDLINAYLARLTKILIETSEIDITDEEKEARLNEMIGYYEQAMKQYGTDLNGYLQMINQTMDQFKEQIAPEALNSLKLDKMIKEIASLEKIEVTEQDIEAEVLPLKVQYQMSDEQYNDFKAQKKNEIEFEVLRRKTSLFLFENND